MKRPFLYSLYWILFLFLVTTSTKSAFAETGDFYVGDIKEYKLGTLSQRQYEFTPDVRLPRDARITNIIYLIVIDDDGDENNFFPADYEIWLSSDSHGGSKYYAAWDNPGNGSLHTDQGFDSDVQDDSDIHLSLEHTDAFDGEAAHQRYYVTIIDNHGDVGMPGTGGVGIIREVVLHIYWEAPERSNLNVTQTPTGWPDPIIIAQELYSVDEPEILYANVETFLTPSFSCENIDIPTATGIDFWLSVDGTPIKGYSRWGAEGDKMYIHTSEPYIFIAGEHTVCQSIDILDGIEESYEDDNEYCRTLTWQGVPDLTTLLSPANGVTCQSTSIRLDWSDVANATSYRFYIMKNPDFPSRVEAAGVNVTESEGYVEDLLPNTRYYWTATGVNAAGWGSPDYYEFVTGPATPAIPIQTTPDIEAGCQPTTLTFSWEAVSEAHTYNLQVDDNEDFGTPEISQSSISATEKEISSLNNGFTYYWRIQAVNECGSASAWSSGRQFTTTPATPISPELTTPENGLQCISSSQTLAWNSVGGASSYTIQVDNNNDFSSLVAEFSDITETSVVINDLASETRYFWRVKVQNSCGSYSGWSEAYSFLTTQVEPAVPVAATPVDNSSCQAVNLDLTWNPVSHSETYWIQIADHPDFISLVENENDLTDTFKSLDGLSYNTTYYWRIKSKNFCKAESRWSTVQSFSTIQQTPEYTVLSSPKNEDSCIPTNVTINWGNVANAVSYTIEIDDNNDFSNPIVSQNSEGNSYNCNELAENTDYYWHVMATTACGINSAWSETWVFETSLNNMVIPVLNAPLNNTLDAATSLTLSWIENEEATSYQLQLDDTIDFGSPLVDKEVGTDNFEVTDLEDGTTYYWQARALGDCALSNWSETWIFKTENQESSIPIANVHGNRYSLGQNYPNPFNGTTVIDFEIAENGKVVIDFMDIQGRIIKSYSHYYVAGKHSLEADLGRSFSGLLIYRLWTIKFTDTKICIKK